MLGFIDTLDSLFTLVLAQSRKSMPENNTTICSNLRGMTRRNSGRRRDGACGPQIKVLQRETKHIRRHRRNTYMHVGVHRTADAEKDLRARARGDSSTHVLSQERQANLIGSYAKRIVSKGVTI
jgi:hypothetical protein